MADVTGARGTANITQGLRANDFKDTVLELEPNSYSLTVLLGKLRTEPTVNPKFSWFEDKLASRFDAINNGAGYTNSATSLVVDDGTKFAQHDLVKNTRTGEIIRVSSVSTNTLTVVRGIGGGAAAMNDNDELLRIGGAQPEGDTSKPARSGNPTQVDNYTQIHTTPIEATNTLRYSKTVTRPNDFARQANHAAIEHAKSWEYIAWHGKPSEDTSGSQPRRTTGGVFNYVTTNVTDAGGAMTEAEFFGAFSGAFRYGNQSTKTMFASRIVVEAINTFARGKLELIQGDNSSTYGLNVMKYVSPFGAVNVLVHNLFEGSKYGGYAAILDLSLIAERPLANEEGSRDTHVEENIQAPDADTRKDQIKTEKGFEVAQDPAHALIVGVTGAG
jgi:hypothetical protein